MHGRKQYVYSKLQILTWSLSVNMPSRGMDEQELVLSALHYGKVVCV